MPDADQIRATVQQYAEVFSAGDKEGYLALFAEDATLEDPVGGEVHRGREAISGFFDAVRAMTPEIRLVPTGPVRVAGQEAAFPGEARPTIGDAEMVIPVVDTLRFGEDGLITELRAYWDFADLRPAD